MFLAIWYFTQTGYSHDYATNFAKKSKKRGTGTFKSLELYANERPFYSFDLDKI